MELRTYLRVLIGRWWIALPTLVITLALTMGLTLAQTPLYQATATYLVKVRVSTADDRSLLSAIDSLNRSSVTATFAEVANSRSIRAQAAEQLGLSADQLQNLSVSSQAIVGTTIIEVSVLSPDPVVARDAALAVGAKTTAHVRKLYEMFELQVLDQATVPSAPTKPNLLLNALLGGLFGVILGAGLAFLSVYLQTTTRGDPIAAFSMGPEEVADQREPRRRAGVTAD